MAELSVNRSGDDKAFLARVAELHSQVCTCGASRSCPTTSQLATSQLFR